MLSYLALLFEINLYHCTKTLHLCFLYSFKIVFFKNFLFKSGAIVEKIYIVYLQQIYLSNNKIHKILLWF